MTDTVMNISDISSSEDSGSEAEGIEHEEVDVLAEATAAMMAEAEVEDDELVRAATEAAQRDEAAATNAVVLKPTPATRGDLQPTIAGIGGLMLGTNAEAWNNSVMSLVVGAGGQINKMLAKAAVNGTPDVILYQNLARTLRSHLTRSGIPQLGTDVVRQVVAVGIINGMVQGGPRARKNLRGCNRVSNPIYQLVGTSVFDVAGEHPPVIEVNTMAESDVKTLFVINKGNFETNTLADFAEGRPLVLYNPDGGTYVAVKDDTGEDGEMGVTVFPVIVVNTPVIQARLDYEANRDFITKVCKLGAPDVIFLEESDLVNEDGTPRLKFDEDRKGVVVGGAVLKTHFTISPSTLPFAFPRCATMLLTDGVELDNGLTKVAYAKQLAAAKGVLTQMKARLRSNKSKRGEGTPASRLDDEMYATLTENPFFKYALYALVLKPKVKLNNTNGGVGIHPLWLNLTKNLSDEMRRSVLLVMAGFTPYVVMNTNLQEQHKINWFRVTPEQVGTLKWLVSQKLVSLPSLFTGSKALTLELETVRALGREGARYVPHGQFTMPSLRAPFVMFYHSGVPQSVLWGRFAALWAITDARLNPATMVTNRVITPAAKELVKTTYQDLEKTMYPPKPKPAKKESTKKQSKKESKKETKKESKKESKKPSKKPSKKRPSRVIVDDDSSDSDADVSPPVPKNTPKSSKTKSPKPSTSAQSVTSNPKKRKSVAPEGPPRKTSKASIQEAAASFGAPAPAPSQGGGTGDAVFALMQSLENADWDM